MNTSGSAAVNVPAKKMILVDDSKAIRAVVCAIVKGLGFEVQEAENGQVLLDLLQASNVLPQWILLDIDMPVMDGLSALKKVKGNPAWASIQVIMCSTHSSPQKIQVMLENGANEYIMKPFTEEILLDKLDQLGLK